MLQSVFGFGSGAVRQKNAELIAAGSAEQCACREKGPQAFRKTLQNRVSRGMAVEVVDELEVVDVELDVHERTAGIPSDQLFRFGIKAVAVVDAGQIVHMRELLEAFLALPVIQQCPGKPSHQQHDQHP